MKSNHKISSSHFETSLQVAFFLLCIEVLAVVDVGGWLIAGIPHLKVVLTRENISKVVNRNQPLADSIRLDSAWGLRKWRAWNHMLPSASGACASCGC